VTKEELEITGSISEYNLYRIPKHSFIYQSVINTIMSEIDSIQSDLWQIKKDVEFIKHVLQEEYELSDEALGALEEARKTPESEYMDLE